MHSQLLFSSLVIGTALGSFSEISCYIQGNVTAENVLNGTLTSCTPDVVNCYVKGQPKFTLQDENIRCIYPGRWWHDKNYCAFLYFFRAPICESDTKCYQIRFKCFRKISYLSLTAWIVVVFLFILPSIFTVSICIRGWNALANSKTYKINSEKMEMRMSRSNTAYVD